MSIRVSAYGNESIDQLLKRFKKMCEKEGLVKQIKRKAYFEKPSDAKRRETKQSVKRVRKLQRELGY